VRYERCPALGPERSRISNSRQPGHARHVGAHDVADGDRLLRLVLARRPQDDQPDRRADDEQHGEGGGGTPRGRLEQGAHAAEHDSSGTGRPRLPA